MAPMAQWGGTSRGEGGPPPARPITLTRLPTALRPAQLRYYVRVSCYVSCYHTADHTLHTHTQVQEC